MSSLLASFLSSLPIKLKFSINSKHNYHPNRKKRSHATTINLLTEWMERTPLYITVFHVLKGMQPLTRYFLIKELSQKNEIYNYIITYTR